MTKTKKTILGMLLCAVMALCVCIGALGLSKPNTVTAKADSTTFDVGILCYDENFDLFEGVTVKFVDESGSILYSAVSNSSGQVIITVPINVFGHFEASKDGYEPTFAGYGSFMSENEVHYMVDCFYLNKLPEFVEAKQMIISEDTYEYHISIDDVENIELALELEIADAYYYEPISLYDEEGNEDLVLISDSWIGDAIKEEGTHEGFDYNYKVEIKVPADVYSEGNIKTVEATLYVYVMAYMPNVTETFDLTIIQAIPDDVMWTDDGAKVIAWIWNEDNLDFEGRWTDWATDTDGVLTLKVAEGADSIILLRFASDTTEPNWDSVLNRIDAGKIDESHKFFLTAMDDGVWKELPVIDIKYYAENNWNGGDWTWLEMTKLDDNTYILENVVFGGIGVNINMKEDDQDAAWFGTDEIIYKHANGEAYTETPTIPEGTIVSLLLDATSEDINEWTLTMFCDFEPPVPEETFDLTIIQAIPDDVMWTDDGAKVIAWIWNEDNLDFEGRWTDWATDTDGVLTLKVAEGADSIILLRFASDTTEPNWDSVLNRIDAGKIDESHKFFITDSNVGVWKELPVIDVKYYAKNNWNGGDWTWLEMTKLDDNTYILENVAFGDTGVDINMKEDDQDAAWFEVANILYEHENGDPYDEIPNIPKGTVVSFRLIVSGVEDWFLDYNKCELTMIYDRYIQGDAVEGCDKEFSADEVSVQQIIIEEENYISVEGESAAGDLLKIIVKGELDDGKLVAGTYTDVVASTGFTPEYQVAPSYIGNDSGVWFIQSGTLTVASDGSMEFNGLNSHDESVTIAISAPAHTHNPVKVNGQAATEEAAGWHDYYACDCGQYFEDEAGTMLIGDESALASWKTGEGAIAKLVHTHNPVKVNGQAATEEAAGWHDYYECACGDLFEDENGTTPIENLASWKAEGGKGYIAPLGGDDPEPTKPTNDGEGLSAGAIVGIVIGSVFGLALILYVLGYFFLYRKGKLDEKKIRVIYSFLPKGKR